MRRLAPFLLLTACGLVDEDLDRDGWSAAEGDCDDLVADIHPGADDHLADGTDQDCDGIDPYMRVMGEEHSCLLASDGQVQCAGDNAFGQLDVPSDTTVYVLLAAGDFHTCALSEAGQVDCWGADNHGQATPPDDRWFVDIGAGTSWSLGVQESGEAICWGLCLTAPTL